MKKEFLNPTDLPNWQEVFSQLVIVNSGGVRTIYVAGQGHEVSTTRYPVPVLVRYASLQVVTFLW